MSFPEIKSEKAEKMQILWEVSWPHPVFGEMGMSRERLHRFGDKVFLEIDDFDGEDQRTYTYQGVATLDEYQKAITQAVEKGSSIIEIKGETLWTSWSWIFRYQSETKEITMIFSGCGGCTPGGAWVFTTRTIPGIKIDKLMLKERMAKGLEIHIEPPLTGSLSQCWGTFTYGPKMPWGPWWLTSEPKILFKVGNITILECFADEYVEDEHGVVAQGGIEYDTCFRYFLIGQRTDTDGEIVWWHNLVAEYDLKNKRFVESSITLEENRVIIKGYGGSGPDKGKTVCIDVETGVKSVI